MRTLAKVLTLGIAVSALAATTAMAATTQPMIGSGMLMDSRTPNGTWKLYSGSFKAGDSLQVSWFGFSHIKLSIYDRLSGQPALDGNGNPVSTQFTGTLAAGWNQMSLSVPVDVADGILVVKNPDAFSGYITYQLFGPRAVAAVTAPQPYVPTPTFVHDSATGTVSATFPLINMSSLPAWNVRCDMAVLTAAGAWTAMPASPSSWNLAPHASVQDTMIFPGGSPAIGIIASASAYGETTVVRYNYLVP